MKTIASGFLDPIHPTLGLYCIEAANSVSYLSGMETPDHSISYGHSSDTNNRICACLDIQITKTLKLYWSSTYIGWMGWNGIFVMEHLFFLFSISNSFRQITILHLTPFVLRAYRQSFGFSSVFLIGGDNLDS